APHRTARCSSTHPRPHLYIRTEGPPDSTTGSCLRRSADIRCPAACGASVLRACLCSTAGRTARIFHASLACELVRDALPDLHGLRQHLSAEPRCAEPVHIPLLALTRKHAASARRQRRRYPTPPSRGAFFLMEHFMRRWISLALLISSISIAGGLQPLPAQAGMAKGIATRSIQ